MNEQHSPLEAPPRRLLRSRDDRVVAGVCGGLGAYTGIDPVVFRIVLAVATLAGGSGVIAYVVAWICIPERNDDGTEPPPRSFAPDNVAAVVIGGVGLLLLLRILGGGRGPFDGDGGFLLLVLVGAGVWWWMREERGVRPYASSVDDAHAEVDDGLFDLEPAPPPPSRGPRSPLPLVGISLLLLLWGALLLADLAGVDVDQQVAIGLSLAVLGGVVVVGARYGRPGGLIVVGVLLAAAGAFVSVVDAPYSGGVGTRSWEAQDVDDLRPSYRLTAGEAVLDLGDLDLDGERAEVEVSVWAGELLVIVPDDVDVVVDGRVGAGEMTLFGDVTDGVRVDRTVTDDGGGGAVLHLEIRMGMGELEVRRAAA